MYTLFISLTIFAAVLLVLVVLAQNSKGGGLSSQFGGSSASNLIGVKKTGDLLDLAVKRNIITKSGAFYTYKVTKIGQGRESARLAIKGNAKLMSEIEKALNEEPSQPAVTITAKGKMVANTEETVEAEA